MSIVEQLQTSATNVEGVRDGLGRLRGALEQTEAVLTVMVTNWALKVVWEAVLTQVTYVVVNRLKAAEGVDLFDLDTDFSPFASTEKS